MKIRFLGLVGLLIILASIITGCMTANPDEQTVPWGRPADWESSSPFYGG